MSSVSAICVTTRPVRRVPKVLKLVGDGGFEPPTSTMSTWRSTPELIAQTQAAYDTQGPAAKQLRHQHALYPAQPQLIFPDPADLIPQLRRLLELEIPGRLEHVLLEFRGLSIELFGSHGLVS